MTLIETKGRPEERPSKGITKRYPLQTGGRRNTAPFRLPWVLKHYPTVGIAKERAARVRCDPKECA